MGEGLKKAELQDIQRKALKVAAILQGGSNISLQQCHRHKHPNRHSWITVAFERWSVWRECSVATGTNTYCPREVSDNTVYSILYTVYCMMGM